MEYIPAPRYLAGDQPVMVEGEGGGTLSPSGSAEVVYEKMSFDGWGMVAPPVAEVEYLDGPFLFFSYPYCHQGVLFLEGCDVDRHGYQLLFCVCDRLSCLPLDDAC